MCQKQTIENVIPFSLVFQKFEIVVKYHTFFSEFVLLYVLIFQEPKDFLGIYKICVLICTCLSIVFVLSLHSITDL